jgi:hypothetical protein
VAAAEQRPVLQHEVHALLLVVTAVDPALERRLQELHRRVLVRLVRDPVRPHEDVVLEHARAHLRVGHAEDVQVLERVELPGLRVLRLEDLGELVVRHRRRRVDLVLQEQLHVERLVDDRHVTRVRVVDAVLLERREELGSLPQHQTPDLLASHLLDRVDPARLPGQLGHPRAGEHLGDETSFEPFSRVAKRFGSQSRPNSRDCPPRPSRA